MAQSRLGEHSPTFSLDTLDVPDTVTASDPLSVSLTVTNTSETSGRFLAAVNSPTEQVADDDESTVVSGSVGTGETETFSIDLATALTTRETDTVTLDIGGYVDASREVEVLVEE